MKSGMTNVDVACIAAELAPLLSGSRIDKAYQPAKDQVLLRMRKKGLGRIDLLMELGRFVTVTKRPPDNPDKPSMVAQVIRNTFGNGRVVGVSQIGFDRLLRIDVEKGDGRLAMVLELFGDGNLLLLGDDDTILLPMRGADHGARKLRKGEVYVPPPGSDRPFDLDADAFAVKGKSGVKDVVRFLAVDLGFGPQWAEELCLRAEVAKGTKVADAEGAQWQALHAQVQQLGEQIGRNDLAPLIIHDGTERIDAVPFPMKTYETDGLPAEEATSFAAALDAFYLGTSDDDDASDDPRQGRFDDAKGKLERQVQQMQEAMDGFRDDEARCKTQADILYLRYQEVQDILQTIQEAHKTKGWGDISSTLQQAAADGNERAAMVQELRSDATATLTLTDMEDHEHRIDVDVRKSVQDNADALYAAAKKARSRQDGAQVALQEAKQRLADLEAKGLDGFGAAPKRSQGPSRHFWFETYRWCFTPNGLVCVGGRNAAQNDQVVKKYLRDGDRYVHAAIHGAPSVVVRSVDGPAVEPTEEDLRIAGQFAVCASRAWRQFAEASAYWVTPNQVNKTPRSGEFVPKGAWIVHGSRNTMAHLPMQWAVGQVTCTMDGRPVDADFDGKTVTKVMGGPPEAFAGGDILGMVPGDVDPNDAAMAIAERFDCSIEDAQAVLPGGPVRFVEGDA